MINLDDIINNIEMDNLYIPFGRISGIANSNIIAKGLTVAIGDIVKIQSVDKFSSVLGMVVGISKDEFTIVPFSFIDGYKIDDKVFLQKEGLTIKCGYGLLGRVVNALGEPIDNAGKLRDIEEESAINKVAMSPLDRGIIDQ